MAFLFTMPGVPFVYYGDEIGMDYIKNLPSKEGGYNRTGSRTPMQWNKEKNCGFSVSDDIYLPTDNPENAMNVAEQEKDENSLLNFVKCLIDLHKSNECLWADGKFNVIRAGYPFVFERFNDKGKIVVAINPSEYSYNITLPDLEEVLVNQNAQVKDNSVEMNGVSVLIAKACE